MSEKRENEDREWVDLLKRTNVKDLLLRRKNAKPLIVIEAGHTVHDAMQLLAEHDVIAAPVVQSKTETGAFLGFVDVLDIAGYILHRYHLDPEKMSNPSFVDEEVFGESVERVINFSRMDEAYALHEAASLHDAVRFFASHAARGVHRVAIVAGDEKQAYLQSVLTQSDLVAFAAEHRHLLPQAKQTLAELGMVRSIVAVMLDTPLNETLETLYRNRVSGLALLDPDGGRVACNFSASDLRALTKTSFRDFGKTVLFFLTKSGTGLTPVASVDENVTLGDALKRMADEHLHRLYISKDGTGAVRGLVTNSDVMKLLHHHHSKHHHSGEKHHHKHHHHHHHQHKKAKNDDQ